MDITAPRRSSPLLALLGSNGDRIEIGPALAQIRELYGANMEHSSNLYLTLPSTRGPDSARRQLLPWRRTGRKEEAMARESRGTGMTSSLAQRFYPILEPIPSQRGCQSEQVYVERASSSR